MKKQISREPHHYQVIVGNIGLIHDGSDEVLAEAYYRNYCMMSDAVFGRASGQEVVLMDGETIVAENNKEMRG